MLCCVACFFCFDDCSVDFGGAQLLHRVSGAPPPAPLVLKPGLANSHMMAGEPISEMYDFGTLAYVAFYLLTGLPPFFLLFSNLKDITVSQLLADSIPMFCCCAACWLSLSFLDLIGACLFVFCFVSVAVLLCCC